MGGNGEDGGELVERCTGGEGEATVGIVEVMLDETLKVGGWEEDAFGFVEKMKSVFIEALFRAADGAEGGADLVGVADGKSKGVGFRVAFLFEEGFGAGDLFPRDEGWAVEVFVPGDAFFREENAGFVAEDGDDEHDERAEEDGKTKPAFHASGRDVIAERHSKTKASEDKAANTKDELIGG